MIIDFNEYMKDRQADRIAEKITDSFYTSTVYTTMEEVEAATEEVIRLAREYDEACKRG